MRLSPKKRMFFLLDGVVVDIADEPDLVSVDEVLLLPQLNNISTRQQTSNSLKSKVLSLKSDFRLLISGF